jgi:ComF family protein
VSGWRRWTNRAIAGLFAPVCAACDAPLAAPLDGAVCAACWHHLPAFTPPLCFRCGLPLPSWRIAGLDAKLCPRCRRRLPVLASQAAIGPHEGVLRRIVHALKYDARLSTAAPLASSMRRAGAETLHGAHLVVPVPLHRRRAWSRGFNQAALLARHLGPPVYPLLSRVRATPPQVSLPAAQRHRNVREAFAVRRGLVDRAAEASAIPAAGLIVVLVDDVCTTGATLEACGRALREAGIGEIRALTASRVVDGPRP